MWQWLIANSIMIFIVSVLVLLLSCLLRECVKSWLKKVMPGERYEWIRIIGRIAFWTVISLALVTIAIALVAIVLSGEGAATIVTTETIQEWFLEHGTPILAMLLAGAVLWFALNRFLPPLVYRSMAKPKRGESAQGMKKRADTLNSVFVGTGKVIVVVVILFMVLSELNVQVGAILAGFGIAGVAVGFGAQYLVRDLIAGIFILMENQYRVGDVANVSGITAVVEEVNLRKTVLRDLDGVVHHVPNGEIKVASNYSRHFSRVNLDVPVAYDTDLDHAISVINRVGQELAADENWQERIITPPQVLRVNNFGDSGIDLRILGDCQPRQQWAVTGELRLRLKKAFDEAGIEIPWPHIKLYFGKSQPDEHITCPACSHPNLPGSRFCSSCGDTLDQGKTLELG